ncbi:MAG: succinylglutamate desuccinylase/aspartoacylase family protein [Streptosporangiaceae bacterium]
MASGYTVERVPVTRLSNGHDVELVVHVIQGAMDGPKLALFGGIHGDEPLGTEAVRRVLQQIDPEQVNGTIVAVPVSNPYAFAAGKRVTPEDGLNLNRIMPGDSDGSVTEQLAAKLAAILDDGCTHFIDYHSGGNSACVDYSYVHEAGAEMSRAYGCKILFDHDSYVGSATDYALERGIRSMVSELGGGMHDTERYLDKAVTGTFNVLRTIDMYAGAASAPPADQVVVTALTVLRPRVGGLLQADVGADHIGEVLPAGTVLGRVVDPYTFEELQVISAPYDPTYLVLSRSSVTQVSPGDYGFMVADGATAKPANQ